jgi:hypothetical protein
MAHDVFISYSRRDKEFTDRLLTSLEAHGYSVWCDRSAIKGGQLWQEEIVLGIEACHCFILVLSKNSAASTNVAKELSLAETNGKHILPVAIDDVAIPPTMGYQLAGIQMILHSESNYQTTLTHLLTSLQLTQHPRSEPIALPKAEADAVTGEHATATADSVIRDRLAEILTINYGPIVKTILDKEPPLLDGTSLATIRKTLFQAGINDDLLERALQQARGCETTQVSFKEILNLSLQQIGPIAEILITPEWWEHWRTSPEAALEQLASRGVPETLLQSIQTQSRST